MEKQIKKHLNIGEAVDSLKEYNICYRDSWEEGTYIYLQIPNIIKKDIIPNMTSLPSSVKDKINEKILNSNYQVDSLYYNNQITIVNSSLLMKGWSPTIDDILATDWITEINTLK